MEFLTNYSFDEFDLPDSFLDSVIATSIYLAGLENPTEFQKQLSTTTNAIAVAGTTAIFGLLDDDDKGIPLEERAAGCVAL